MEKLQKSKIQESRKSLLKEKRGQVGIEYMILIGFITFIIIGILTLSLFYSGKVKDEIKINQVENFAAQLINSAESVFFAGEPSKTTVRLYLPAGVTNLEINSSYLIITTTVSSGENKRAYKSRVPINGTISSGEGIKKLSLEARESFVQIE